MSATRTTETVLRLVHAAVGPERAERIDLDSRLLHEGGLDSFGLVALVVELDKTFSITLSNDDLTAGHFDSVRDIALLVDRYLAAGD